MLRISLIAATCLSLAACMDVQQQVHVAPDGLITVTATAQIKREVWDLMPPEQRAEVGCGEQRVSERNGMQLTTYGRTTDTEQRCFFEILIPSADNIPEDFPLHVVRDGDMLDVTMAPLLGRNPPTSDIQRMAMAGGSWSLIVKGEIAETSGEIGDDGLSSYRIVPLIDALEAEQRPGIRARFSAIN